MGLQSKRVIVATVFSILSAAAFAQKDGAVYFKGATSENRNILRRNIIQHTITGNLSAPLNTDTEDNWIDAFEGMELLRYKSPWADNKISIAFDSIENRSPEFQRALLELVYSAYRGRFNKQVTRLLDITTDSKVFAMSAEYLLLTGQMPYGIRDLESKARKIEKNRQNEAITGQLYQRFQKPPASKMSEVMSALLGPGFLKNHIILYSFQRKDRNFPGLALIRDSAGNVLPDDTGGVFCVPQLARSMSNLPGYLTNGNTPQGIYRMYGFDTSKTSFIGPSTNIQLTMPFETSLAHFFNDTTITDTVWTEEWYKKLLPPLLKYYGPLFESYYAGKAGRTEIIAHGTTVDPAYYSGEPYYPQTPTLGCLCAKEIWSPTDGKRLESDQEKLAMAIRKVGGPDGYCVVIEINDEQKPVTASDILPFLK